MTTMLLPVDLVFLRHAESEANAAGQASLTFASDEYRYRALTLTDYGRAQARTTGDWLRAQGLSTFDRYYISPYLRARETAARLGLGGPWAVDDRLRECEPGINPHDDDGDGHSPEQKWYRTLPGGEAPAVARLRSEAFLDSLRSERPVERVIAVTHGKLLTTIRFIVEQLTPEDWLESDRRDFIHNCQSLHYTRRDPASGATVPEVRWLRSVCPWDLGRSWDQGRWRQLPLRRYFSDAELLHSVQDHALRIHPLGASG